MAWLRLAWLAVAWRVAGWAAEVEGDGEREDVKGRVGALRADAGWCTWVKGDSECFVGVRWCACGAPVVGRIGWSCWPTKCVGEYAYDCGDTLLLLWPRANETL